MATTTQSGFGRAKLRGARDHAAPVTATVKGQGHTQAQAFRIAGVQMASGPNVAANLNEAGRLIEAAVAQGARLVALPMAAPTEGKIYNSCQLYDDSGKMVARYDKIHLFNLDLGKERFAEEGTLEAGKQVKVVDSPFGRIGLSVCYDLRFPELYRAMKDVDIIVVPSAFTETTGRAHWESLVRARAIENLAYVLAPAQGGYHLSGRETHGDSMVVDPWGTILDRLPRGSGVVVASINPAYQASLRKSLPALSHRVIHRI